MPRMDKLLLGGKAVDNWFEISDSATDSALAYEAAPQTMPSWCAFALGGMVTFLLVYIGIGRPRPRNWPSYVDRWGRWSRVSGKSAATPKT